MASGTYNHGSYSIQTRAIDWAADVIKLMLLATDTPYVFDKDHDHIDDINPSELAVSGYAGGFAGADRRTLASKTITEDSANDRSVFDAADPASWTLAAGKTVASAVVYWHNTSDAVSIPIFFLDFTDFATTGGMFGLIFHADGIGYIQQ